MPTPVAKDAVELIRRMRAEGASVREAAAAAGVCLASAYAALASPAKSGVAERYARWLAMHRRGMSPSRIASRERKGLATIYRGLRVARSMERAAVEEILS